MFTLFSFGYVLSTLACTTSSPQGTSEYTYPIFDTTLIDQSVESLKLSSSEKVWTQIPWVSDYNLALEQAQKSNRPIFFFAMYGELDGRC